MKPQLAGKKGLKQWKLQSLCVTVNLTCCLRMCWDEDHINISASGIYWFSFNNMGWFYSTAEGLNRIKTSAMVNKRKFYSNYFQISPSALPGLQLVHSSLSAVWHSIEVVHPVSILLKPMHALCVLMTGYKSDHTQTLISVFVLGCVPYPCPPRPTLDDSHLL